MRAPAMAPLPWSPTSRSVAMASTNALHDISHSSDDGAAVEAVSEAASAADTDDDELASSTGVLSRRLNCWAVFSTADPSGHSATDAVGDTTPVHIRSSHCKTTRRSPVSAR